MLLADRQTHQAVATVNAYRAQSSTVAEDEYKAALRIKEAVLHPDTGLPIPLPL